MASGVSEKYSFLLALGGEALRAIFSAEVGFGLLGELLLVLSQGFQPVDWPEVVGVLNGLSRTPRFGLNVSLLSRGEKGACEELFLKIQTAVDVKPPFDVCQGDETPSRVTAAAADDGGGVAQNVETAGDDNSHEKLKHLMEMYGTPSSGP